MLNYQKFSVPKTGRIFCCLVAGSAEFDLSDLQGCLVTLRELATVMSLGKPLENDRKTIGKSWLFMGFYGIYPLVMSK